MKHVIAIVSVVAACGGGAVAVDPLAPNTCLDDIGLAFCDDFDRIDQQGPPFGFAEFLGGDTTAIEVIAENGNRGLSVRSEGAAFGRSSARPVGSATSATARALIAQPAGAPGDALVLGLLLLDGSTPDGRQVWLVAGADGTLAVDALGDRLPTTGRVEPDRFTAVSIDARWTPGATELELVVRAGAAGDELVPILEGHAIQLAPPPELGVAVAIISSDPGARHLQFDNVVLDIGP